MPLAFDSLSHGRIAFGFFNIDSDMLLLDRCFFFATDFCELVGALCALPPDGTVEMPWEVWAIDRRADIGDLMGAIHGVRFEGFIGALYRRFPFPARPEDFHQDPEGWRTQTEVAEMIAPFARQETLAVTCPAGGAEIALGEYRFDRPGFQQLLDYVWRGGYPRWRDQRPPGYVRRMRGQVLASGFPLFAGTAFSGGIALDNPG